MSIIPALKWRWWSLILRQDMWCNLPPEIAVMIHNYLTVDDPIFIKQKHIPLVIDKPGRYIIVENINFQTNDKNIPCIHITSEGVYVDGRGNIMRANTIGILYSPPNKSDTLSIMDAHYIGCDFGLRFE
mgnify:CR=1 FL=1